MLIVLRHIILDRRSQGHLHPVPAAAVTHLSETYMETIVIDLTILTLILAT